MTPAEILICRLMNEEVSILKETRPSAVFGSKASETVGDRLGIDRSRVHRVWLRTALKP